MDATGALQSLLEITLLGQLGPDAGVPATPAAPSTATLEVGQFVSGQVLATAGPTTLVSIGGQPYRVNLPEPTEVGQSIAFQVLRSDPDLQLRIVSDAATEPPAAAEVALTGGAATALAAAADASALPSAALAGSAAGPAPGPGPGAPTGSQAASPATLGATAPSGVAVANLAADLATQLRNAMDPSGAAATTPTEGSVPPTAAANEPVHDVTLPAASNPTGASALARDLPGTPAAALAAARTAPSQGTSAPTAATGSSDNVANLAGAPPAAATPPTVTGLLAQPGATSAAPAQALPGGGVFWSGPIWPGQDVEVRIEPDEQSAAFEPPALNNWRAEMRLTLPALGEVRARLAWSTGGLRIGIAAEEAASADALRGDAATLLANLRSLDIRVHALGISHGT